MTGISSDALMSIAKGHLGLPLSTSDARVPQFYIDELRRHLVLYPAEHSFRVTLQPNAGLGFVTCLKNGCNEVIPLVKRVRCFDGGRGDGLGSLSAYRRHLFDHESSLRQKRVTRATELPKVLVKETCNLPVKSEVTDISFPPPSPCDFNSSPKHISSPQVKAEVKPKQNPSRKRPLTENPDSEVALSSAALQVAKKVKTGIVPLYSLTNTETPTATNDMFDTYNFFEDPFVKLDNVRAAIDGQQGLLNEFSAKPFKTMKDIRNIIAIENEMSRLRVLEGECYLAAVTMPSSSSAVPFVDSPHQYHPPHDFDLETDEKSLMAHAFPMETVPGNDYMTSSSFPVFPAPADTFRLFSEEIRENNSIFGSSPCTSPVRDFTSDSIFGSSPRTSPVRDLMAIQKMPDPAQIFGAQASSSKHPQMSSDEDDSEVDSDNDGRNVPDTSEFLRRIGIEAPLPIRDDGTDANGDFYGRGRDLFDGPRASNDDLEKFLIQAGNAEIFNGNERVEDALNYLGLKNLNVPISGMEVTLMAHQAIGVKWMLEKERSDFKGGCLADEMGLGKTVQMIATMLQNKPTNPMCKTTLIVAPLALLDQWKTEIETKTNCGVTCLIYHGSSKTLSKKKLLQHDVVLTTFNTLAREWPDLEAEMRRKAKAKKRGDNFVVSDDEEHMKDFSYRSRKRKERAGLLFQVEFFRSILDEGQNIRNRRTRVSRAVTDIQANYRWCLTGTPIINTLVDAYAYLRYLQIRPWHDWNKFNSHIAFYEKKKPNLAITRLHAVMNTFILRRQKNTKLDGKPIIDLPGKEVKLVKLEFSKEERDIYKMIEARNRAIFNSYLREGTVLKNYHHVLVLLLRLRQICSHASLIAEDANAFLQPEESREDFKLEFATELTRARRLVSHEFVIKMQQKFREEALDRIEAEKASANATIEEDDCPICFDVMTDAVITPCGHIFCRECIVNFINSRPLAEVGDADRGCPCCREPIDSNRLFSRSAFEPMDKALDQSNADSDVEMDLDENDASRKNKGKVTEGNKQTVDGRNWVEDDENGEDDMSDFIVQSDEDEEAKARRSLKKHLGKRRVNVVLDSDDEVDTPEEKEVLFGMREKEGISAEILKRMPRFLPSSKMKYMMIEIERIFANKPDEKILVVSQWTSCLSLVSDYLSEKEIPHVKYQGDMNRTKREQAIRVFMSKEKARVMLMSLKCGGVGLNLTRANNVISLDLGWSLAIESQAFDRVHRLGQRRKVLVQRVVISDTVEDRILQLQERKKTLADGSLGDGSAKKMGRLSVKELANLFGLDVHGRILHD